MKVKSLELRASEVTSQKGISLKEKNRAIDFILQFVETFTDPLMIKVHTGILKSNYLSLPQLEIITKRMNAFSIEELLDPATYIEKYWKLILKLDLASQRKFTTSLAYEDREKASSLKEFYFNYGYLTERQINLSKAIMPKHILIKIIKHLNKLIESNHRPHAYELFLKDILINLQPGIEINYEDIENRDSIFNKILVSFLIPQKAEVKRQKDIEEAHPIPQTFLSLEEMRKALAYVV